jgi:hypothetical protein
MIVMAKSASDEATQLFFSYKVSGLLRFARNDEVARRIITC